MGGVAASSGSGPAGRQISRPASLLLLGIGALTGLAAGSQSWWRLSGPGVSTTITGTASTSGLAQVLPACVLVAGLLSLVLRTWGRRLVGLLTALIGVGMAVIGGLHHQPDPAAVRSAIQQVSLSDRAGLSATAWVWAYLAAGVLTTGGAVLMLVRGSRWPSRAQRYQASAADKVSSVTSDPDTWWKALDAGVDPTQVAPDPTEGEPDPISPTGRPGATMAPGGWTPADERTHDPHDIDSDKQGR